MKVTAIKYKNAREDGVVENYYRRYLDHEGLAMAETLAYETRSDITEKHMERIGCDNGRTWGEWVDIPEDTSTKCFQGEHQLVYDLRAKMWNPVHKHTVQLSTSNIMVNGYDFAMSMKWQGNNNYQVYHSYLNVVRENGDKTEQMIQCQDGEEFDPDNWVKPTFLDNNCSLCRSNIELDTNGDILFTAEVPMRTCCEILGRDIMEVYPSYPDFPSCIPGDGLIPALPSLFMEDCVHFNEAGSVIVANNLIRYLKKANRTK